MMNIKTKEIKWQCLVVIILLLNIVSFAQTPDFSGLKVCIDPGHSGHESDDRGMTNGFWESESNLTKGLFLRDLLEARGCEVFITRTTNSGDDEVDDLPLSQRAQLANDNNADLFISIHSNAGNQVSNYPMTIFNGKTDDPAIQEAKDWAIILWEQLISNKATFWTSTSEHYIGDLTLNPSWTNGYGVLYPLEIPGVISEGSFHDYKPEVDRLLNIEYRKQEAWNIYYAMANYFQLNGTEDYGQITGLIHDSLLVKELYTIPNSPDKYEIVKNAKVEIIETGSIYNVGDTANAQWYFSDNTKTVNLNAGFYYFDSLPAGIYHVVFSALNYFNDTIELEVKAHEFTYWNEWLEADKTMPPQLISTQPLNGETIKCFDPLQFTFNMNMDSTSFAKAFSISPTIDGHFEWDDDYLKVGFQPNTPYEKQTEYTVFIDSTVEHQWGVHMDTTISFSFITDDRNRFIIEKSFPALQQVDISPYLQFRIIFDAPLMNSTLIDAVSIIDSKGATIGTKGAKISIVDGKGHYYFNAAEDLNYNEEYTLKLAGSIKDETNIPIAENVEIKFKTEPELGILNLINGFEDITDWTMDYANSNEIDENSFLYRWTKVHMEGSASLLVRYGFLGESGSCLVHSTNELNSIQNSDTVGLWIYGEMSKNSINLVFDELVEKQLTSIDFAGWKYCKMAVPESGSLLTGIKINQTVNGAIGGDLYFDMLSQSIETSNMIESNGLNIQVFPNPIKNGEISIKGLINEENYFSIYETTGKLVQYGKLESDNKIVLNSDSENCNLLILRIRSKYATKSILLFNN